MSVCGFWPRGEKMAEKGAILFLTCPKRFHEETGQMQVRAIRSWRALGAEVALLGPETDVETAPVMEGVFTRIVPGREGISKLPLFSDLLKAITSNPSPLLCYLNADILLPGNLAGLKASHDAFFYEEERLPEKFLITGSRWDLGAGVFPEDPGSNEAVVGMLQKGGPQGDVELHDESAMDYFIFPKGMFDEIPPLIVGRGGYDNALLAYCMRRGIPVIDSSREWPVLHQFHGYQHKAGGRNEVYFGDEAMFNRRTHRILHSLPNSLDADFCLDQGRLIKTMWRCGFWRRLELITRFRLGLPLIPDLLRVIQRCLKSHLRASRKEMARTRRAILS